MTILVTGATGTVGRSLVEQLLAAGHAVRALTRRPAAADLPAGVEVVGGDLADVATLGPALEGATAAHLITFAGDDYASLTNGPELVAALEHAGVRRASVLGGWDVSTLEPALAASAIASAELHPVEFMANIRDHADAIRAGEVHAFDLGRESAAVHEADIAAVALAVLTEDGHDGRTYELTGGEAVDLRGKLDAVGAALGREIALVRLDEAQARAGMAAAGLPDEAIEFAVELESMPPGVGSIPQDTVRAVTGRAPRTYGEWARDHVEEFR